MKSLTCPTCKGKGKHTCETCKGKGDNSETIKKYGLPGDMVGRCRDCYNGVVESCRTCHGAGIVEPPEPQLSIERWQMHTAWIEIIRPIVENWNRKNAPTKRLATAIEKAINDDKVSVYWYPERYGFYEIVITVQGDRRWTVDDKLTLSWSKGIGQGRTPAEVEYLDHPSWAHLDETLNIYDGSDYLERITQEKSIAAKLDRINGQIANLEEQIAALREEAKRDLEQLPTPASAKIRIHRVHWDQPTIYAKTTYPAIWPSKK